MIKRDMLTPSQTRSAGLGRPMPNLETQKHVRVSNDGIYPTATR